MQDAVKPHESDPWGFPYIAHTILSCHVMRSQFPTPESRIQNAVEMWQYMKSAPEYTTSPLAYWKAWGKKMVAMEKLTAEELAAAAIRIGQAPDPTALDTAVPLPSVAPLPVPAVELD